MKCEICGEDLGFRWTDTHGIGACVICGAPYRIYHYSADNKRLDLPPELMVRLDCVGWTREYWKETKKNCAPGIFNFPGSSYEVATEDDFASFNEWLKSHPVPETTA